MTSRTPFPRGVFAELLEQVGPAPRRLTRKQRKRLAVEAPSWLTDERDVSASVHQLFTLLEEGRLVWGAVVQANRQLFSDGPHDCPAVLVLDVERQFDDDPRPLRDMAHEMFEQKGETARRPEEQLVSDLLGAETANIFFQPVPESIARGTGVHWSAVMFFRHHMPHGHITTSYLPALWHPDVRVAAPLPGEFWTDRLRYLTYPTPEVERLDR